MKFDEYRTDSNWALSESSTASKFILFIKLKSTKAKLNLQDNKNAFSSPNNTVHQNILDTFFFINAKHRMPSYSHKLMKLV